MDQSTALTNLTATIPQLSQVPQCILPAYGAIAAAGCGPDLACICGHPDFFGALQGFLFKGACTNPVDAQESILSTQKICSQAAPWLTQDRGPVVVVSISILLALATITVVLRVFARRLSKVKWGIDDWLIGLALVFAYAMAAAQYLAVHYSFGKHILMVPPEHLIPFVKAYFATTTTFPVSVTAAKLSALFFYHRIFPDRRFRLISIVIGLVTVAWFITFIFLMFFTCVPLDYNWDKTIPGGHCIDAHVIAYYGTSPGDIITNVAILVLPIPYLWKLQMRWQKKFALIGIFVLGSFAVVGSIVRIPLIKNMNFADLTYTTVHAGIWLAVEVDIGILSLSLPMLRPLLTKAFPSGLGSPFSRSRNVRYGTGSERLPDLEKAGHHSTKGSGAGTLVASSNNNSNVYGGGKPHKSWYDNAVSVGKHDDADYDDGSSEEMVPMGQIAVRHDVDWDTKDVDGGSGSAVNIHPPASTT